MNNDVTTAGFTVLEVLGEFSPLPAHIQPPPWSPYDTVQIFRAVTVASSRIRGVMSGRWYLHYGPGRATGPFPTRARAVAWFANGGR